MTTTILLAVSFQFSSHYSQIVRQKHFGKQCLNQNTDHILPQIVHLGENIYYPLKLLYLPFIPWVCFLHTIVPKQSTKEASMSHISLWPFLKPPNYYTFSSRILVKTVREEGLGKWNGRLKYMTSSLRAENGVTVHSLLVHVLQAVNKAVQLLII